MSQQVDLTDEEMIIIWHQFNGDTPIDDDDQDDKKER